MTTEELLGQLHTTARHDFDAVLQMNAENNYDKELS